MDFFGEVQLMQPKVLPSTKWASNNGSYPAQAYARSWSNMPSPTVQIVDVANKAVNQMCSDISIRIIIFLC